MDTVASGSSRRPSLASQIYAELRRRLSEGEIEFGTKLVDVAVAAELGVSRMPVREALSRLVFEGYLVGTSRGYERAEIRFDDAADIFEMRRLLEPRAAGSVASRLSKDAIAQLTTAFETAGQTIESDITQFVDAHRRFRNTWLSEVPNRRLARAIERYGDLTDHIRQLTLSHQEARRPALDFLSSAFDAFKSHDGMRAHDCVARQIDTGWEFYCELVRLDHHAENAA